MSSGRWFSGELRTGIVVVARVLLGCISVCAVVFALVDWFWSEGHWKSYGQLRPWPFLIPVAFVAGWLAVRGLPFRVPRTDRDQ